jgi:unsaturated rhamnogalacturonyl hydrolase
MKKLFTLISFFIFSYSSFAQVSNTWSVKFADAIIARWPTASGGINAMTAKGWEYSNAIVLQGIQKVYGQTNTASYLNYIQSYVDVYVNSSGGWTASAPAITSLDKTHPGILALFLYEKTGLAKYKTISTTLRNMYVGAGATYSKTVPDGILWHKMGSTYDNVCLIDGIYMLHPFLAKYGRLFNDNAAIDTAVNQTLFIYNKLYDNTTHLIRHAWTSTPAAYTWDDGTGRSNEVWSRGMGWFVMALIEELKYVPSTHAKRGQLLTALANLATGMQTYQDATTGLWYQVVDKGGSAGNYLETSGSAMFVYALKTAVDSSWINSSYLTVAQNGWTGLKTKISNYSDSRPAINDFAPAMSVQDNYSGYIGVTSVDCPSSTAPHGYAAILMAASVMEFLSPGVTLPVNFINFTATREGINVSLKWQVADYTQASKYIVERSQNGIDFTSVQEIKPRSNTSQWIDAAPAGSTLYYRIKAVSTNNEIDYSKIVRVDKESLFQALMASPNPVNNGVLNISAQGIKAGSYDLSVSNNMGELIISKRLYTNTENLEVAIPLPASAKGIVYIQLKGIHTLLNKSIFVH